MSLYFIADIAANHDKNLNRCYELIARAKDSGAHAVKFQHFKASNLISKEGFDKSGKLKHHSKWHQGVYETFNEYALPYEWTGTLANYCKTIGVDFMSTPYDLEALDLIDPFVTMHKIGSGDIDYKYLLDAVNEKGKPVLIGTGAASIEDVSFVVSTLSNCKKILMQCNSNYTRALANRDNINLNVLKMYQLEFPNCEIGISDHNKNRNIITGAVAIGAKYIERHFTDGQSKSPDNDFAMKPHEWREMVNDASDMYNLLGDTEKDVAPNELDERIIQRRVWYVTEDLPLGSRLSILNCKALRPALKVGVTADVMIYDSVTVKSLKAGDWISYGDIQKA